MREKPLLQRLKTPTKTTRLSTGFTSAQKDFSKQSIAYQLPPEQFFAYPYHEKEDRNDVELDVDVSLNPALIRFEVCLSVDQLEMKELSGSEQYVIKFKWWPIRKLPYFKLR